MNLHLFLDSPFVDRVVAKCDDYGNDNHFVLFSNEPPYYSKTDKAVRVASYDELKSTGIDLSCVRKVFIHFFSRHAIDLVLDNKERFTYYWFFWGADGYSIPELKKSILLPKTKKLEKYTLLALKKRFHYIRQSLRKNKLKQAMAYVDYCCTFVNGDYDLIKSLGYEKLKFHFFSYLSIEDLAPDTIGLAKKRESHIKVQIGNSLNNTNNHLDAIDFVKRVFPESAELIFPVSYSGKAEYLSTIKAYAKETHFRTSFLEDFIPLQDYLAYMNSCDFVVFFHVRQQSANNSLSALWLGKIVIMRAESTLYKFYKKNDLSVVASEEVESYQSLNTIVESMPNRLEKNRAILMRIFNKNEVAKQYEALFA
ncbi:TDP-N-acetylfucosamine:lipid II N-acetylfucosaminyltransferase [Roseivirga pacifica]|uniref:TDP-N-acetylfucosamine:lipid II N-acetylfucosaminyltransferase n=1 Tax=Roseivirga pacifica TaxID=1267423 RepID=UPI003BA9FF33